MWRRKYLPFVQHLSSPRSLMRFCIAEPLIFCVMFCSRCPFKSDSSHHLFRHTCTKSGSLRFSQFPGCWLILSVYILMSFDFPFVRLFGVRLFCYYHLIYCFWLPLCYLQTFLKLHKKDMRQFEHIHYWNMILFSY